MLKELSDPTCVNTCNLGAKCDFIALKAELDKLDINELITVPTGLETVRIDFRKLNDVVSKEVLKNKKFNPLNTKVNNLEKNISKAEKKWRKNLEKKIGDVHKKYQIIVV